MAVFCHLCLGRRGPLTDEDLTSQYLPSMAQFDPNRPIAGAHDATIVMFGAGVAASWRASSWAASLPRSASIKVTGLNRPISLVSAISSASQSKPIQSPASRWTAVACELPDAAALPIKLAKRCGRSAATGARICVRVLWIGLCTHYYENQLAATVLMRGLETCAGR
jgi:hypothetical protein